MTSKDTCTLSREWGKATKEPDIFLKSFVQNYLSGNMLLSNIVERAPFKAERLEE